MAITMAKNNAHEEIAQQLEKVMRAHTMRVTKTFTTPIETDRPTPAASTMDGSTPTKTNTKPK